MANGTDTTAQPDAAATSLVRNRRTDAMFVCAFGAVQWLVYLVVFHSELTEYAQGVLTLVLGNFIGWLAAMYNYETGTTRGAQTKDATLKGMADNAVELAKTAPKDIALAVAAARAPASIDPIVPTPAVVVPPIKADTVDIQAQNATVNAAQPEKSKGDTP
jgi:hypothetical protein